MVIYSRIPVVCQLDQTLGFDYLTYMKYSRFADEPLYLMVYTDRTQLVHILARFDPYYSTWEQRMEFAKFVEKFYEPQGYRLIVTRNPVGDTDRIIPPEPSMEFVSELVDNIIYYMEEWKPPA